MLSLNMNLMKVPLKRSAEHKRTKVAYRPSDPLIEGRVLTI